jgi:hypothetical protein
MYVNLYPCDSVSTEPSVHPHLNYSFGIT